MGSKTVLMDSKEEKLRYNVAVALRQIADGLAKGKLALPEGVVIPVADVVVMELEIKKKAKDVVAKYTVGIELTWIEGEADAAEDD